MKPIAKSDVRIEYLPHGTYETVARATAPASGLKAIIAIHDRTLGPALGGCRMWPYATHDEALTDALRLASGMTFKSALAGVPFGGGKAVIMGDPGRDKSVALLHAFGRFVETFEGRYITGEDVGIGMADVDRIAEVTRFAVGTTTGSGDPSPVTAMGVLHGIRAALRQALGRDDVRGSRVAVQGVGKVGTALCEILHEAGAGLTVCDVDAAAHERARARFGARVVAPDEIYDVPAEVLAPCALGGVLNDETIPRLKCRVVAGAANNQLLEDRDGARLWERGILYAPDYVVNAGGLINVAFELRPGGYDREAALAKVAEIGPTLGRIFALAEAQGRPTNETADQLARERLDSRRIA